MIPSWYNAEPSIWAPSCHGGRGCALHTSFQTLERTKRVHEAMTVNELLSKRRIAIWVITRLLLESEESGAHSATAKIPSLNLSKRGHMYTESVRRELELPATASLAQRPINSFFTAEN